MAANDTGEAAAFRRPRHVDQLPDLEGIDSDNPTDFDIGKLFGSYRKFPQQFAGFDTRFGEVPRLGLRHAACAALAERDLHGRVSIRLGTFYLRHAIVGDVKHRHRHGAAVVGKNARHAKLATYKT